MSAPAERGYWCRSCGRQISGATWRDNDGVCNGCDLPLEEQQAPEDEDGGSEWDPDAPEADGPEDDDEEEDLTL